MVSRTCKLQLLSVAVLGSAVSVGASILLLLASGCWQTCGPLVPVHSPLYHLSVGQQHPPLRTQLQGSSLNSGGWKIQLSYQGDKQPHSGLSYSEAAPSAVVGESRERETTGSIARSTVQSTSHPNKSNEAVDVRSSEVVKGEVEENKGKSTAAIETADVAGDWSAATKPTKHKRLSKKRLLVMRALARNSSNHTTDQKVMRIAENDESQIKNHSHSHPFRPHTNTTSFVKLVPGTKLQATSPSDLCASATSQCTEFLTSEERDLYTACEAKTAQWLGSRAGGKCHCQFMNTSSHARVALVSLPGSGNTWLRGLLERATGVCTGSQFCDKTLRAGGMCGEGLRGGGVLGVKTHDTRLQWTDQHYRDGAWSDERPFYDAAIVLVRSPFRALIAEWNRQKAYKFSSSQAGSSHIKYLDSPKFFLEHQGWDQFVGEQVRKWKMVVAENMLKNRRHPVLLVQYEQLKTSPLVQMRRVLDFLQFPHSEEALTSAVQAGFSSFYRNHTDSFQHFTPRQRAVVEAGISETVARLTAHNLTEIANQLYTYVIQ